MAGEGDPVDVQFGDVQGVVRGELSGVQDDPGSVRMGRGGQFPDGPQLAGHVGGAGHAHQRRAAGLALGQRLLQGVDGLAVRPRCVEVGDLDAGALLPRQQGGVVLGLEDEHPGALREYGGEEVERVGGGAGEDHLVVGAAAEEVRDGRAAVLEEVGGQLREVSGAAVDAAVVRGVGGDVVPDALEGGGAGGVVERGVDGLAAGHQRDEDISAQNRQRGTNGTVGGNGGDRHGELP